MTDASTVLERPAVPSRSARQRVRLIWQQMGMVAVFILLYLVAAIFVPHFVGFQNQRALGLRVSTIGIVSCTMLFCLAAGDFDLSVGSVVALAGVVAAETLNATQSITMAVAAGLVVGTLVGFVNGIVIAQLRINALITTLATMQIVRGAAFIVTGGPSVGITNDSFLNLGLSRMFGLDLPIWIMLGFFAIFGVLLNFTVFGRNTLAVGGNLEAARLAGVRATRVKVIIFAMQGAVAAFAGIVLASRFSTGDPNASVGLELQCISACVLGGVSLTGGIGSMVGVVVGVMIMGTVADAMDLLNIQSFWQQVANGSILLAAVLIDKLQQRSGK